MQCRLLLDVIVRKGAAIFQLLASEDKSLLVRGDALLVLDLALHIINSVRGLDFQCDGLASQGLHENLHTTTETEDEMESALLLDIVIGQGAPVLELLARKNQALLVRRNTFLVLDLRFYIINGIGRFDLEGDGLAGESLDDCGDVRILVDVCGWRE